MASLREIASGLPTYTDPVYTEPSVPAVSDQSSGESFLDRIVKATPTANSNGLVGGSARSTLAQITREQWDDYKKRFFPIENKLINAYDNPERKATQIGEAINSANSSFDTAQTATENRLARYGLNANDDPAYARQLQMGKAAAVSDAANEARRHAEEVDRMILSGGLASRSAVTS